MGWHRTESLWREIYARTMSGLLTLLVVYLLGVASGVFTRQALPWVVLTVGSVACGLGISSGWEGIRAGSPIRWNWWALAAAGLILQALAVGMMIVREHPR